VVLWLVRRRGLREEYTPIWLAVAFGLAVVSLRLDLLQLMTRAIGAWSPSSTIFFLGQVFLVAICLNYAVRLSRTSVQIKNLSQEIALLRADLERRR
jgi:tellurite resistance protein TehA-like permease